MEATATKLDGDPNAVNFYGDPTSTKFYAVRRGYQPGIYTDYKEVHKQVTGFPKSDRRSL